MHPEGPLLLLIAVAHAWTPHVLTTDVDDPEGVAVADLDGDGDVDVMTASSRDDTLAVYENLGGGRFGPQQVLDFAGTTGWAVTVADLDGDGRLDVLGIYQSGAVWFRNAGGFTFEPGVAVAPAIWLGMGNAAPFDLDGDGDLDIALAEAWGDALHVVENRGAADFAPPVRVPGGFSDILTNAWVAAADVDGDGDDDLVTTGANYYYGGGQTAVHRNDGGVLARPAGIGGEARSIHVGQLDHDPMPDVYTNGVGPGTTLVYLNDGGRLGAPAIAASCEAHHEAAVAADVDGDGDDDLVCAAGSSVVVYESVDGVYAFAEAIDPAPLWVHAVAAGDLDGDGDLDVLVADWNADEVRWLENDRLHPAADTGDTGVRETGAPAHTGDTAAATGATGHTGDTAGPGSTPPTGDTGDTALEDTGPGTTGPGTPDSGTAAGSPPTGGDSVDDSGGKPGGCGCATGGGPSPAALALLALFSRRHARPAARAVRA